MSVNICPTITAFNNSEYASQMEMIRPFTKRLHIDLMDGEFAPTKSPPLNSIQLLEGAINDIHLMYKQPSKELDELYRLGPSLVVVHYEAEGDLALFAEQLKSRNIKAGLAVLSNTEIDDALELLKHFDHALIFSGNLGYHGGEADLRLIEKVKRVRQELPYIEIGWDGGVNNSNALDLVKAGVNVLNVGSYIHSSSNPAEAYSELQDLTANI